MTNYQYSMVIGASLVFSRMPKMSKTCCMSIIATLLGWQTFSTAGAAVPCWLCSVGTAVGVGLVVIHLPLMPRRWQFSTAALLFMWLAATRGPLAGAAFWNPLLGVAAALSVAAALYRLYLTLLTLRASQPLSLMFPFISHAFPAYVGSINGSASCMWRPEAAACCPNSRHRRRCG